MKEYLWKFQVPYSLIIQAKLKILKRTAHMFWFYWLKIWFSELDLGYSWYLIIFRCYRRTDIQTYCKSNPIRVFLFCWGMKPLKSFQNSLKELSILYYFWILLWGLIMSLKKNFRVLGKLREICSKTISREMTR